jgi:hypothetical protein
MRREEAPRSAEARNQRPMIAGEKDSDRKMHSIIDFDWNVCYADNERPIR